MRVFITRRLPDIAARTLRRAGLDVTQWPAEAPPPRAELLAQARGCAGLLTLVSDRVDAELLDAAGAQLRIVANYAVGYDNIDLHACRQRGVRVSNTPDVLTEATADLTWALILSAARRVIEGDALVRSGRWAGWSPTQLLGLELHGATIGIVGAGRIGSAVARRAAGFGMRILYCGPRANAQIEADYAARRVTLPELLTASDIVTLHLPLRPQTRHLIAAPELAQMRTGAILVNTSRGPVVDESALVQALRRGPLAAAGLDVYEHEPRLTPGLTELPNVVLLPHLGSATHTTRQRMAALAAENIVAVLSGREPLSPVA